MYHDEYRVTGYSTNDAAPIVAENTMKYNAKTNQQIWNGFEAFIFMDIAAIKFEPIN